MQSITKKSPPISFTCIYIYVYMCIYVNDDDGVYLKKNYDEGVTKFNLTQKCRPAEGIRELTYK
jgi:hypothetical protein